ncbi:hypothetical protein EVAR_80425_1 [Eumeta japonica]|uniref:Uncharacterized protein n=1 Tax=Eumeta variegata TaxID=151549 RepID=A0A4C1VI20_EUMVA|nr:hypothetical protein EVAR_80425_1 [Eumeta japonica]
MFLDDHQASDTSCRSRAPPPNTSQRAASGNDSSDTFIHYIHESNCHLKVTSTKAASPGGGALRPRHPWEPAAIICIVVSASSGDPPPPPTVPSLLLSTFLLPSGILFLPKRPPTHCIQSFVLRTTIRHHKTCGCVSRHLPVTPTVSSCANRLEQLKPWCGMQRKTCKRIMDLVRKSHKDILRSRTSRRRAASARSLTNTNGTSSSKRDIHGGDRAKPLHPTKACLVSDCAARTMRGRHLPESPTTRKQKMD